MSPLFSKNLTGNVAAQVSRILWYCECTCITLLTTTVNCSEHEVVHLVCFKLPNTVVTEITTCCRHTRTSSTSATAGSVLISTVINIRIIVDPLQPQCPLISESIDVFGGHRWGCKEEKRRYNTWPAYAPIVATVKVLLLKHKN